MTETSAPMPPRELFRYELQDQTHGAIHAISFFSPQELEHLGGLPGSAILARMKDPEGGLTGDNLEFNGAFLQLLHETVQQHFPLLPDLQQLKLGPEATHLYVHVTRPGRTARSEEPADIIGRFAVRDGKLDPATYEGHPGFAPVTPEGMFIMHPDVERALISQFQPAPPPQN
jgi:hypothetical protein